MTSRSAQIAAPALVALAVTFGSPSRADTPREHVERATRFYNLQDWPSALKEYKKAYAADPKPEILWSIAQVQRLSGDCRNAVFTYKAYIRGASVEGAKAAQDHVDKCEATLAAEQRAAEQRAIEQRATEQRATEQRAAAAAKPAPPRVRSSRPWIVDPLGDVLGLAALGGLVTGVVFLGVGNVAMSEAANAPSYQAYDQAVASARTQQQVGIGVAVGGAVFAGLAIWRFASLAGHHAHREEAYARTPHFVVTPVPGGVFSSCAVGF